MKYPLRFAPIVGLLALGISSASLSNAVAQPQVDTFPGILMPIPEGISAVSSKDGVRVRVNVENMKIAYVLNQLASRGNLDILTQGAIQGQVNLSSQGSPENVLEALCKSAHLSCQKVGGVWMVEKSAAPLPNPLPVKIDLVFQDVEVGELVGILIQQFDLKVNVSPTVKGKIALIRLTHSTPRQALEKVALAADLDLVEKDGQLTLAPKTPVAP